MRAINPIIYSLIMLQQDPITRSKQLPYLASMSRDIQGVVYIWIHSRALFPAKMYVPLRLGANRNIRCAKRKKRPKMAFSGL